MMLYWFGVTLCALVILDGLLLWSIGGRSRYPVKRLMHNTLAVIFGGLMIWLS